MARKRTPWAKVRAPSAQPAASMGGYSHGCVAGAATLPLIGKYHVAMRPERARNFGHPILVSYVQDLARALFTHGWGVLAVGDLGQARGGPAPSGHKSHQSGLDADIWYVTPPQLKDKVSANVAVSTIRATDLLTPDQKGVTDQFDHRVMSMLHRAAIDPRVARIFVNPRIKEALCARAGQKRKWLRKIRPWWGHSAHFHVRLACPAGDTLCENQAALPAGDGCDKLEWWFDEKAQAERLQGKADYRKNMGKAPTMPAACQEVLRAQKPAPKSRSGKRKK